MRRPGAGGGAERGAAADAPEALEEAPPAPEALESIQPSAERFFQLAMFAVASFLCAMDWTIIVRSTLRVPFQFGDATRTRCALSAACHGSQAPVYQLGEERFHVGLQRINSLSNVRRGAAARSR